MLREAKLKNWTTPVELAKDLGISRVKVDSWIRSGELVAINIGTTTSKRPIWRIPKDELKAFLKRRSSAKPSRASRVSVPANGSSNGSSSGSRNGSAPKDYYPELG